MCIFIHVCHLNPQPPKTLTQPYNMFLFTSGLLVLYYLFLVMPQSNFIFTLLLCSVLHIQGPVSSSPASPQFLLFHLDLCPQLKLYLSKQAEHSSTHQSFPQFRSEILHPTLSSSHSQIHDQVTPMFLKIFCGFSFTFHKYPFKCPFKTLYSQDQDQFLQEAFPE